MKPTHKLKVLNKVNDHKTDLGCGWLNTDGSISLSINPCVVIVPNTDLVYTLFPISSNKEASKNDTPTNSTKKD